MVYATTMGGFTDIRGLHYKQGLDHLYFVGGTSVYRMPVNPAQIIVTASAQPSSAGSASFNFNSNVIGATITQRQLRWATGALRPSGSTVLHLFTPAEAASFDEITPTTLRNLSWSATAILEAGTSTTGTLYGVRYVTNGGYRYAKLRVYFDGAITRFDWITYRIDQSPSNVCTFPAVTGFALHDVLLNDNEVEMYLSGAIGFPVAVPGVYRFLRTSASSSFNANDYLPIDIPDPEPQQLAIDGSFVYVVANSGVYRFTILDDGSGEYAEPQLMVRLPTGVNGIGLLINTTGSGVWAYISDDQGYIRVVNLSASNGSTELQAPNNESDLAFQVPLPSGETSMSCGYLGWGNAARTEILVTDPSHGRVVRFYLEDGTFREVESGLSDPWNAEAASDDRFHLSSDREIGLVTESILVSGGNYLLGIGLVPFQAITNSVANPASPAFPDGRANTGTAFPGANYYFYQYPDLPFGGELSLQLNLEALWENNIRSYSVALQRRAQPAVAPVQVVRSFSNLRWNEVLSRWETVSRDPNPANQNRYAVPPAGELWYNPYLAAKIPTGEADTGWNEIIVRFYDLAGNEVTIPGDTGRRLIYIDNQRYRTSLRLPRIGTETQAPAPDASTPFQCGCITYPSLNKNDLVEVDFQAWHDNGAPGEYSLRFYRGGTYLGNLYQTGQVVPEGTMLPKTQVSPGVPLRVGHLMGDCNVANIRVLVSVSSRVIDGFGWVNLGSYSDLSFTMLHAGVTLDSPWSSPV